MFILQNQKKMDSWGTGLQQIYFLKVSNKIKSTTIGGGLVEVKIGTFSQFEKHDSNSKV